MMKKDQKNLKKTYKKAIEKDKEVLSVSDYEEEIEEDEFEELLEDEDPNYVNWHAKEKEDEEKDPN